MVAYLGSDIAFEWLKKNLSAGDSFTWKRVHQVDEVGFAGELDLVIIGPDLANPVKVVQKIVAKDKLLSIVILAAPGQLNHVKQTLQFSPFVGKNAVCISFQEKTDLSDALNNAVLRTRQKRAFSRMNLSEVSRQAPLAAVSAKLENMGQMLEHAPLGVVLIDHTGMIVGVNRRARAMFSVLDEVQIPLERIFEEQYVLKIKERLSEENENILELRDINDRYYEVSTAAFVEDDEKKLLLLINDVSERREKDLKVRGILESLPQMAWTATPQGQTTFCTPSWYSYTDQTEEEALGEGWALVLHPEDFNLTVTRWEEAINQGKVFQQAARYRRYDGEYRWHMTRAIPVYSSKQQVIMWVGSTTDIHDHVLRSEALEKKVRERTRSLEQSNAELEQFTYISSHDLQEPLRKIRTFAHLVRENCYDSIDKVSQKYLDKIISTATGMGRLIKDLLDFIELRDEEKVAQVNLNEVLKHILEDPEHSIDQTKISIDTSMLPTIEARPFQMRKLFYNLVANAIKFKKPDTDPVINITARKMSTEEVVRLGFVDEGNEYWDIVVRDNGIGFEQKYADQIFSIFQRLHGRSAYEGTGIGLSICKKVVDNHGGKIFAISTPGEGSEFHVVLPRYIDNSNPFLASAARNYSKD